MNRSTGIILAMALGAVVGACASAGAGGPTADGFKPRDNSHTRQASQQIALAMLRSSDEEKRELYQSALESAQQAIAADSTNPRGWFVAGQAYANLGEFDQADAAWDKAVELYPAYEQEILSEREAAWVTAYNEGVTFLQQDDLDAAIARMEAADRIYQGRPEAKLQLGVFYARRNETDRAIEQYRGALEILRNTPTDHLDEEMRADWATNEEIAVSNLAQLLVASGREAEAEEVYREVLANNPNDLQAKVRLADVLARQGKSDEADQLYNELIGSDDLTFADYITIGVGQFQVEQYEASASAFRQAVRVNPYSRDAHYNLAQAIYVHAGNLESQRKSAGGAEQSALDQELIGLYTELAEAAESVLELDPFNRNIIAYQARAYQALSQLSSASADQAKYRQKVQEVLDRHESAPFEVLDINLMPGSNRVTVSGQIMNLKVQSGTPIRLRFTLMAESGATIGSEEVSVVAPEANAAVPFEVAIPVSGDLGGWKYERVQ